MDIRKEVKLISEEILSLRRQIHMYPELGNNEYRTAGAAEEYLKAAGIDVRRVRGTGIIGILEGEQRGDAAGGLRTVALRADMDALPVCENTGSEFSSRNPGIMHACGHDAHTAALLGAAGVLAGHRNEICGRVIFIFQPDEEGDGGAAGMIEAGALEGADAVFGAHVSPDLPAGTVGIRYGSFYASADTFDVEVKGRASHAAEREKGIDALAAAAEMTAKLLKLPEITGSECVLTVGTFRSGTARNILADRAEFSGIVRSLGRSVRERIREEFLRAVDETDKAAGTRSSVSYKRGYPGVTNDHDMTVLAERAALKLLGPDHVALIDRPTMKTEDFGFYQARVPGSFYHIGAGCENPLHSPEFIASDEAVLTAAAMHVAAAVEFLRG